MMWSVRNQDVCRARWGQLAARDALEVYPSKGNDAARDVM